MNFVTNNSKPHAAEGCYKIIKMSASKSIFKYKVINYCIVLAFIGLHFNSEVCVRAEWSSNSNKQGKSPHPLLSFFRFFENLLMPSSKMSLDGPKYHFGQVQIVLKRSNSFLRIQIVFYRSKLQKLARRDLIWTCPK